MKTKMSLSAEMDLTQDSVVQLTCWCGQIALHELWGLGRTRLDRITRRKELLGSQSLAVVMQPDKNGMPQTEKARRLRAEAIPKGVPTEFRVPALRTPRTRREQQLKMVGDRAATMAWQLMALACVQELGFGADRLNRLYAEMRHNYEQLNEWGKTDGLDVAMEKLRRCACDALQTEDIVVENVDDEKTVQTLSRSYKEQEAEFLKRAVMMAAGRKACRQSLNVLNEESVRQKCADAMAAATGSNLSPLRSGYASALQSSPDMGAKDQCKNPSPKNYRWKMERRSTKDDRVERARAEGLSADERAETRMVRVYSCYGADGTLLGKGTAAELKDKGLFGSEGTVHECYRKRGGVYKPGGVTRMEMELCQKRIRHPMKLPDQPAKVKRKPIGGVIDPSALAYDVHDLMIYNEKARKIGKPELTYGYWAEKGKPATP